MRAKSKEKIMKNHHSPRYFGFIRRDLCVTGTHFALLKKEAAMSRAQAIAQQLSLTPQQNEKVLPILAAEAPKVQAIKDDNSLSKLQKIQQLKAIHQQTDSQMKAILSPEKYDPSAAIRLDLINRPHHHARQIKGEI